MHSSLQFVEPTFADRDRLIGYLAAPGEMTQEFSFVNWMMWKREFHHRFSLQDGQLILRLEDNGRTLYSLPLGGDLAAGLRAIRDDAAARGEPPCLWAAGGARLEEFLAGPGAEWTATAHRDGYEYLYDRAELAALSGKKFHGKRNHIAAFSKQFDWAYEDVGPENLEEVFAAARAWYLERSAEMDETMETECASMREILLHGAALGVRGGLIRVDGRVAAFTFGSPLNDRVFDVHVEKALNAYADAYPVINREFAARLTEYELLNREDDLGLEGLRRAKLSYHPALLLPKYTFLPKQEATL